MKDPDFKDTCEVMHLFRTVQLLPRIRYLLQLGQAPAAVEPLLSILIRYAQPVSYAIYAVHITQLAEAASC